MNSLPESAKKIKLIIFDIDGVLTTGALYFDNNGDEYKAFNSKDGHGIRMLLECGLDAAIITGRKSKLVKHRMNDLGLTTIYQGYRDKRPAFKLLLEETGVNPSQIAYVGDDVIDLPVMTQVGLAVAVGDAHDFVKQNAHFVTNSKGGCGAGREIIELILDSQGLLSDKLKTYLE